MATDPHPDFTVAMFEIYRRAKAEAKYDAKAFLGMVADNYGFATARTLINGPTSIGYTALYDRDRLDLTVEAMIVESLRWRALFLDSELKKAEARLKEYRYTPRTPS